MFPLNSIENLLKCEANCALRKLGTMYLFKIRDNSHAGQALFYKIIAGAILYGLGFRGIMAENGQHFSSIVFFVFN